MQPLLDQHGLHVDVAPHSLAKVDLYSRGGITLIPAWTISGRLSTFCSGEWKARVIERWLRTNGVGSATNWIGFTWDERHRVKHTENTQWCRSYPLIDLMLTRADCERILLNAGLP